jgi:hypothetical protein
MSCWHPIAGGEASSDGDTPPESGHHQFFQSSVFFISVVLIKGVSGLFVVVVVVS